MPNYYLSVLYKHIIQVENKNVGLKVGGHKHTIAPPVKKVGGHMPPLPPPPPPPLPTPVTECAGICVNDYCFTCDFMMDTLRYFSFQPVLHNWCNKGRGMCYHVCGMVNIKQPLPLIKKSSPCGCSGFPLSLSEWSFTMSDAI